MRIRGSLHSSSSSPSSFSSISTDSFASSTNFTASSSSNSSFSSFDYETRCEGLDLLVKAVLHVAGSVLGVPFTQRRVIRRRKRAFRFSKMVVSEIEKKEEEKKTKKRGGIEVISKPKKRKRVMAVPSKYHDSVLQPWKRQTRRRRSIGIDDASG